MGIRWSPGNDGEQGFQKYGGTLDLDVVVVQKTFGDNSMQSRTIFYRQRSLSSYGLR